MSILNREQIPIKISIKSLRALFHPCDEEYIRNMCFGRCCYSRNRKTSFIAVHPTEERELREMGAIIIDGIIQLKDNKCPFKDNDDIFCILHKQGKKPFACCYHPFKINKNNTLIVMRRYYSMICYKEPKETKIPVYYSHRWCLEQIFGEKETQRIIDNLESRIEKDFYAFMNRDKYIKEKRMSKIITRKLKNVNL